MPIQALLLSLVVLFSIIVNSGAGHKTDSVAIERQKEQIQAVQAAPVVEQMETKAENNPAKNYGNPFVVFASDFYSSVGKNLALAAETIGENLNLAKEIAAKGLDKISLKPSQEIAPAPTSTPDSTLVAQPKLEEKPIVCDSGNVKFTNKEMLAKVVGGKVIFESNSENRWPIASITKLMTAVIALEKTDTDKQITISEDAAAAEGVAGGFKAGETFKEIEVIKAMLVVSSNKAAMALAENFEGGKQNFINEMQKKASELKMFQTTYLEPTGLSFINQSTAKDLSALMDYIYVNHPEILEMSRQKEITITDLGTGKSRKIQNIDKFAGESDFVGGKTGFIDESGRNLIGVFDMTGKTIITVILGADKDVFKETSELKNLVQNCK